MITRRFRRYLDEREQTGELDTLGDRRGRRRQIRPPRRAKRKFAYPPNLVVVDGGPPQVAAAQRALDELGIDDVAVCGLAKRLEEVWLPGEDAPGDPAPHERGPVPAAAGARRGAPVRDHLPPGEAVQGDDRQRAGRGARARARPGGRRCCGTSARCATARRPASTRSPAVPGHRARRGRGGHRGLRPDGRTHRRAAGRSRSGRRRRSSGDPGERRARVGRTGDSGETGHQRQRPGGGRARHRDHHRAVRGRPQHRGEGLEDLGWFVVDNLPPGLLATMVDLAARSAGRGVPDRRRGGRAQPGLHRRPARRARRPGRAAGCRRGCCSSRPRRRCWSAGSRASGGRTRCRATAGSSTASPPSASCCAACAARPTWCWTRSTLNVHELRARMQGFFGGDARRWACGSPWCRSATSTACRWTPTSWWTAGSCPTRTGSRSSPAHRAGPAGPRLRARASRAPRSSSTRSASALQAALAGYEREGKRYLTLAVGCTGGKHRSVAMAEQLAARLGRDRGGRPGGAPGSGARVSTGPRAPQRAAPQRARPGRGWWRSAAATGCTRRCPRCAG